MLTRNLFAVANLRVQFVRMVLTRKETGLVPKSGELINQWYRYQLYSGN